VNKPRVYQQSVHVPNRDAASAHVKALVRDEMRKGLADYILGKEIVRTVGEYTTEHRMCVYVLSADELQNMIEDGIAKQRAGYPYYHS